MTAKMTACPHHEGAFDCPPFCILCEGNQEWQQPETMPCQVCSTAVDTDIWLEEMHFCVDCSHTYFNQELSQDIEENEVA